MWPHFVLLEVRVSLRNEVHRFIPLTCLSSSIWVEKKNCDIFNCDFIGYLEAALVAVSFPWVCNTHSELTATTAWLTVWVILWVHREVTECPQNELSMSINVSSQWVSCELKFFNLFSQDWYLYLCIIPNLKALCSYIKNLLQIYPFKHFFVLIP